MTTTEVPNPYAEPTPVVAPAARDRALASAVAVFLGGYILVQSLLGQLAPALSGYGGGAEVLFLLLSQLVFAVVVVIAGFFLAPTTAPRKLVASAIVVVGVIVTVVSQVARLSSGFGGIASNLTVGNAIFMVALTVGAGWLVVRSARLGWLALLAAFVLIPVPFLFAFNGVAYAISQPISLILFGIVGTGILLAGRPAR